MVQVNIQGISHWGFSETEKWRRLCDRLWRLQELHFNYSIKVKKGKPHLEKRIEDQNSRRKFPLLHASKTESRHRRSQLGTAAEVC